MGPSVTFNLAGSALRVLSKAQNGFDRAHRHTVLFFALDLFSRLADSAEYEELDLMCPGPFSTAIRYWDYHGDEMARDAMFVWEVDNALAEMTSAMRTVADFCRERADAGYDDGYRRHSILTSALADYMEMTIALSHGQDGNLRSLTPEINPYVSANYLAATLLMMSDSLEQRASSKQHNIFQALSASLLSLRSKIINNLPDESAEEPDTPGGARNRLTNMLNLMNTAGRVAWQADKVLEEIGENEPQLHQGLRGIAKIAGIYGRAGEENEARPARRPFGEDNLIVLRR